MILDQFERFKDYIEEEKLLNDGETVVVAVSGGPDSSALLHLLQKVSGLYKLRLVVAHLNHCMRPEADREAREVKKWSEGMGLSCEIKAVDVRKLKEIRGVSEEVAGREARYAHLFSVARVYGAKKIALGHHLDDQAETVLLNVIRGTGIDGLAGILPKTKRQGFYLIRPLLCMRRKEVESYCEKHLLQTHTDSTNLETEYKRNKIRLNLLPRLEEQYNPKIRENLINLAEIARLDRLFLQNLVVKIMGTIARPGNNETSFFKKDIIALPAALAGRVLRFTHKKYAVSGELNLNHLKDIVKHARSADFSGELSLPGNVKAFFTTNRLYIAAGASREVQKRKGRVALVVPGKTRLPGKILLEAKVVQPGDLNWPPSPYRAYLDFDSLPPGEVTVCYRWPGARFHPQGAEGPRKLKKFLIDQKVSRQRRDYLPLVTVNDEIIWVAGLRIAQPYRVTSKTGRVLVIDYRVQKIPG